MVGIIIDIVLVILVLKLIIKLIPLIIQVIKFAFMAIPIWILLYIFVPGFLDEGAFAIIIVIVAVIRYFSSGFTGGYGGYSSFYDDFVLNRNTGVIRRKSDPTVSDVSERNRRVISRSRAEELVGRRTRYRYKRD